MSFFDLSSYEPSEWDLLTTVFAAFIIAILITVFILLKRAKKQSIDPLKMMKRQNIFFATAMSLILLASLSFISLQFSAESNKLNIAKTANVQILEEYALSEYDVELTVTEINASPEPGSLTEYYHYSRKGVKKIPASGLTVATAVDPETRTAYSFDANKDHEIVLLKNGEPVELKKAQSAKG